MTGNAGMAVMHDGGDAHSGLLAYRVTAGPAGESGPDLAGGAAPG
jgi:hypothetical protein